ncbi:MAG: inositol monophosphatase family protein [Pseudomonadota bacterium]
MTSDDFARACTDTFFELYMPQLLIAGGYALGLQGRVGARPTKDGDAWTSVLTDADLGVQHFLEAVTLGAQPDWGFFGEEHESSFNTAYFPADAQVSVLLDPINGTRLYRDGADSFDIIISLTVNRRLTATLSYMPARGQFFGASRFEPAFHASENDLKRSPLINRSSGLTLAVYQDDTWRGDLPRGVNVFDVSASYQADDPRCCLNSVFTGELDGYLFGGCALLDIGATAFTVTQAGGQMSLPNGDVASYFDEFHGQLKGPLLVTMNDALHSTVASALKAAGH